MINSEKTFNKNILIAVDESENARRAVSYVCQLLAGAKGFKILILHVIRQPDEDYFPTSNEKEKWILYFSYHSFDDYYQYISNNFLY